MQNKKIVVFTLVLLLGVFIGGSIFYKNSQNNEYIEKTKQLNSLLERDYSYSTGKKDAKVTLVEFFDPACGTCAQFHPYVKDIMKNHNDEIRLVLRYAPFHKNADYAVKVLEASKKQGKFMSTLEFMFSTQSYWINHHVVNPMALWQVLYRSDLDMNKLNEDMKNTEYDKIIAQDLADAKKLGANKTPAYFVNGKPLVEFGLENLKTLIKEELKVAK
jgi:protein-disulfide isomerase